MTSLPASPTARRLGLVIDLDTCVGCQACVVHCKEWNTCEPLPRRSPTPIPTAPSRRGVWLNRVHGFELDDSESGGCGSTVHFPRSCLHCENAACVTVCPTGASYKRAEDGIVLVDEDKCIGCGLCAWACPYGAREMDRRRQGDEEVHALRRPDLQREPAGRGARAGLCRAPARPGRGISVTWATRRATSRKLVAERDGVALMPELGYRPTNRYLPPRRQPAGQAPNAPALEALEPAPGGFLGWLDRALSD